MFKSTYSKLFMALIGLLTVVSSCTKSLDAPSLEVAGEKLHWRSISDSKSGLIGIYGLMRAALVSNNGHWIYGDVRGGDFSVYSRGDLTAVKENKLNASFPVIEKLSSWQRFYAVINAASVFIEKTPQVLQHDTRYTETNLKMDIAQARALRAFAYFYMVRVWGDVPLLTKSFDNGSFEEVDIKEAEVVLNYAEKELTECLEDLPYRYGSIVDRYYGETPVNWEKVLFNKISAYAVLSHIAAWQGKYIDVAAYTKFILDNYESANITRLTEIAAGGSGVRGLTGNYGIFSNNFAFGQIVNFSSAYVYGEATSSGHMEQLTLAQPVVNKEFPDIYVDKSLITDLFEDLNDKRFGVDTISGLYKTNYFLNFTNEIPIFNKIRILRDGVTDGNYAVFGSNLVFTRLEEIHLLRAEALAVLGNRLPAIEQLNIIKSLRGIENYSVLSTESLIDEIFQERRRELMGEGWRFYDLVRYHKIKNDDLEFLNLINKKGIFWPIATDVLNRNSKLAQNQYWN